MSLPESMEKSMYLEEPSEPEREWK